jgi:probable addiction module antidote protein
MTQNLKKWDIYEELKTEKDIIGFLEAALSLGDYDFFLKSVGVAARARANMKALAQKVGVSRPGLYKSFSGSRRPNFVTVVETLDSLGIDIKLSKKSSVRLQA